MRERVISTNIGEASDEENIPSKNELPRRRRGHRFWPTLRSMSFWYEQAPKSMDASGVVEYSQLAVRRTRTQRSSQLLQTGSEGIEPGRAQQPQ